jgi:hypothetical protein
MTLIGTDTKYKAIGFKAGHTLRFVVKAFNYFGTNGYSDPSAAVTIPQVRSLSSMHPQQACDTLS